MKNHTKKYYTVTANEKTKRNMLSYLVATLKFNLHKYLLFTMKNKHNEKYL